MNTTQQNKLLIPNLMTTNAPLSLQALCKHMIRAKKEFKANDFDIQQLISYGILKRNEIDKIKIVKIFDAVQPLILKYNFVEPLKRSYAFSAPTMILAQFFLVQEEVDTVFDYWLSHYSKLFSFENRKFWRNLLLKFEGSKYWYKIFWELYKDCIFEDGDFHSFRNVNRHILSMKIDVTPRWYEYLVKVEFPSFYEMVYYDKTLLINTLIQCGDVELNPGPVMSRFMRYNDPSINKKHEAQWGLIDETRRLNDFLTTQLPTVIDSVKNLIENNEMSVNRNVLFADLKIKEDLKMLNEHTGNALDKLQNMQSNILKTLVLISIIGIMTHLKWYKTAMLTGIITLFSLFGIPEQLINQIKKVFGHEAQLFSSGESLGALIGSIICYFIIGKLPKDSTIENFSKKTNNISRGLSGMININKDLGKIWKQVQEFVIKQVDPNPEGFLSMEDEMIQWMKDIEYYIDIIVKKKATIINEQIIKISNLLKQGLRLRHWAFTNKCSPDVCRNISNYIRTAEQLYNYADKNNTLDGGQRQRPLCIVLFGESQIGKSGLIYPLAQDLCYAAGYRKSSDIDEQIYARQPETEFWDGYKGQFIVVRDDCLAAVDDVSNPNPELHETIREMNDFPYHLHMAALEDKNSFYTSKVGIMTINDINAPIRSLTYPEAFYNRISDHMYQVTPAEQFRKVLKLEGNNEKILLDINKVRQRLDELSAEAGYRVPITTEIYNFIKYKKVVIAGKTQFKPDMSAKVLNYDEFSALMCAQLQQRQDDFNVKKEFMEKRLKNMIAEVGNDDEFFDCSDITNTISERICNGESLLDIECDLLNSSRAEEYLEFKNKSNKVQNSFTNKLLYYSETMFESAVLSIKAWFDKCKQLCQTMLDKYPALKYIFMLGTVAVSMFAIYKCFIQEEKIPHFITGDIITAEEYERNSKWISQQKNLSFNERMSYWKTNLLMANPDEHENILNDTKNIPFHINEAMQSPSSGKTKNLQKHIIEVMQSPSNGKDKKLVKHRIEAGAFHESEGSIDVNAVETAFTIMKNNLYSITYVNDNGKDVILGNAIALQGHNYLIPYHFVKYLLLRKAPLSTKLNLSRINYAEKVYNNMLSFELRELVNSDGSLNRAIQIKYGEHEMDAIIFNISTQGNSVLHRSILKHFIEKNELGRLRGNMQGLLLSYHNDNGQVAKVIKSLYDVHNYEQELRISVENESYIHRVGYLYNGDTMKGDCGGPLIIKSNSLTRKIVGIHISGSSGEGYSAKLYQELLQQHIDELSRKVDDTHRVHCYLHIDESILKDDNVTLPEGVFNEIGTLKVPLYQASRSVLKPSLIYGEISEPITKPAHLKPFEKDGVLIDPAYKGLEKCGGITPLIDSNFCKMARNYVQHKLFIDHKHVGYGTYARVLTYEESIMGTEDLYMSAVCRSTSPGYPFNSDIKYKNNKPGKQQWMGNGETFDFTSSSALQLRNIVQELEENCEKGIITGVVCADTMKDERRPIKKVDEGKTRMFSACPMHFVVLFRKYYLGFAAFIMHNRNKNGIAVGTNPYNEDWDQIVRQISMKGKRVLAGDFSNYDGSLNTQVLWLVYEIIENFYKQYDKNYNEKDAKIRYSLWLHIVNSIHVYGDTLYQWTHSQPSGNPFTVIINSVYNLLILVIGYLVAIKNSDLDNKQKVCLLNTMSFDKHVSPVVYGDDNILNISDYISDVFNQQTLTDALRFVGHEYTEETKDGKMHLYRNIDEISFLKRRFVFDSDTLHYVAPLDKSVIYEMLNWIRGNSVDPVFLLRSNIETALREISLHGEKEFDEFVFSLCANKKVTCLVQPYIPTYGEVRCAIENMDAMGGFSA
jgi:hypothetical protein